MPTRWPRSLGLRLLMAYLLGMLVCLVFIVLAYSTRYAWQPNDRHGDGLEDHVEAMAAQLRFDAQGTPLGFEEAELPVWAYDGMGKEVVYRVLDDSGRVVLPAGEGLERLDRDVGPLLPARRSFATTVDGVSLLAASTSVMKDGQRWHVQFALSDRLATLMRRSFGLPQLGKGVLMTSVASILVFAWVMRYTLRRVLRPLSRASAAAARIAPTALDERLDVPGLPSEMEPLIAAFNAALDRLESGYRAQQAFLSDTAHELKTPLALIRAQIEMSQDPKLRENAIKDVDHVARQVHQLLHLAEAQEPRNYQRAPVSLWQVVEEVVQLLSPVADRYGVHLDVRVAPELEPWHADHGALFTLLKNLVENAIQHSPAGGVVAVHADAHGLVVRDEGPGVAPEHLRVMFDRFWRGPSRRDSGAGLGLSICREIAAAHGWTLTARLAQPGLVLGLRMLPCDVARPAQDTSVTERPGQPLAGAAAG